MRRYRLVLAVIAMAVVAVAWWASGDGLSADEERLVGTWIPRTPRWENDDTMRLARDRSCAYVNPNGSIKTYLGGDGSRIRAYPPARWYAYGGVLVIDYEMNSFRRALRPVADRIGLAVRPMGRDRLAWVTADELVLTSEGGRQVAYTRAHQT